MKRSRGILMFGLVLLLLVLPGTALEAPYLACKIPAVTENSRSAFLAHHTLLIKGNRADRDKFLEMLIACTGLTLKFQNTVTADTKKVVDEQKPLVPFKGDEKHADPNGNSTYDSGEIIYKDNDNTNTVSVGDDRLMPVAKLSTGKVKQNDTDIGTKLILFKGDEKHLDNGNKTYDLGEAVYKDKDNTNKVSVGDVRLLPVRGYVFSTVVTHAGTTKDLDVGVSLVSFKSDEKHTDLNSNSAYDPGEGIYKDVVNPSGNKVDVGDIRLTAVGNLKPGKVKTGDADIGNKLISFQTNEKHADPKNPASNSAYDPGEVIYKDKDSNNEVSAEDIRLYNIGELFPSPFLQKLVSDIIKGTKKIKITIGRNLNAVLVDAFTDKGKAEVDLDDLEAYPQAHERGTRVPGWASTRAQNIAHILGEQWRSVKKNIGYEKWVAGKDIGAHSGDPTETDKSLVGGVPSESNYRSDTLHRDVKSAAVLKASTGPDNYLETPFEDERKEIWYHTEGRSSQLKKVLYKEKGKRGTLESKTYGAGDPLFKGEVLEVDTSLLHWSGTKETRQQVRYRILEILEGEDILEKEGLKVGDEIVVWHLILYSSSEVLADEPRLNPRIFSRGKHLTVRAWLDTDPVTEAKVWKGRRMDTETVTLTARCRAKPPMENWRCNNLLEAVNSLNASLAAAGDPRRVELEIIQDNINWGDYVTEFVLSYGAGEAPDIWLSSHTYIGAQAEAGRIIALDELMKEFPGFDNVIDNLWDSTSYKGEIWGIPQDAEALPLYFNKTLLSELGWTADKIEALPGRIEQAEFTLYDMLEVAKEAVDKGVVADGNGFWTRPRNGPDFTAFYYAFGGETIDYATGKLVFDEVAGLKYYQFFYDAAQTYGSMGCLGLGWGDAWHPGVSGSKVLFWVGGTWHWPDWAEFYLQELGGEDYMWETFGFGLIPAAEQGGQPNSLTHPMAYLISSQCEHPDLALALIDKVTDYGPNTRHAIASTHLVLLR